MNPIWIITVTLFSYWFIGFVVLAVTNENERFAALWTMGLVYWIFYLLFTPWRIIKKYRIKRGE